MRRTGPDEGLDVFGYFATPQAVDADQQLLSALFHTSIVGVAVCDSRLRYRAINHALASMNGIPAEAHIGKTIQQVLGKDGATAERALQRVLSDAKPLSNFQVIAKLPARTEWGHWVANFYPLKDRRGKTLRAGAVIWEITKRKRLEHTLSDLTGKLRRASGLLRSERRGLSPLVGLSGEPEKSRSATLELLDGCMADTQAIAHLLKPELLLTAPQHHEIIFHPRLIDSAPDHDLPPDSALGRADASDRARLTQRELQVLRLLTDGKANKEVADILNTSVRTVETHRARIMLKLGLHSIAELVLYAVRNKLVVL